MPAGCARWPIEGWAEAVAFQPGIVATGDVIHVRGGRSGEARVVLDGLDVGEPFRGKAFEIPALALARVEVETGPFDARYAGALAGVVSLRTLDPPSQARCRGVVDRRRWARHPLRPARGARRRAVAVGRLGRGLGLAKCGSTTRRCRNCGRPTGPTCSACRSGRAADSRVLSWAKLARTRERSRAWLEAFGSHTRQEPFDPAWVLDGWISNDRTPGARCSVPTRSTVGWRYKAPDHHVIEDDRRVADRRRLVVARQRPRGDALGRLESRPRRAVAQTARPIATRSESRRCRCSASARASRAARSWSISATSRLHRERCSSRTELKLDAERRWPNGSLVRGGTNATYDAVELWELDRSVQTPGIPVDSLREFRAWAPGASGYVEGRWANQGMVLQGGLAGASVS